MPTQLATLPARNVPFGITNAAATAGISRPFYWPVPGGQANRSNIIERVPSCPWILQHLRRGNENN